MANETTSTTRSNPLAAAGAMIALAALLSGCGYGSSVSMYAQEAHAQQVEAWCHNAIFGHKTESIIQQCVEQAWINVPPGECDVNASCPNGHFVTPYDARREYAGK